MKTANKTMTKVRTGTVRRDTAAKSKRSDADKYGILPGDNWAIQVHKIAQSIGGIEIPPHK